ncbi:MAG TPA: hypothetical protein VGX70_15445 [Gemmataceae bacterium]|nr:hypothetical protein [Gemmataceae bacterium]
MSVVSVADLLQTDDLFQLGQPRPLPALPDLEALPAWPCCHDCPPSGGGLPGGSCISTPINKLIQAPNEILSDSGMKRSEAPAEDGIARRLPRHLPSLKIQQTPYSNDPLLLEQPPPVPVATGKQEPEI